MGHFVLYIQYLKWFPFLRFVREPGTAQREPSIEPIILGTCRGTICYRVTTTARDRSPDPDNNWRIFVRAQFVEIV
jgi:hypothetical protein